MGILATVAAGALAAGALGACYAPSLRDCTVSCESASDCASGQVCGGDRLCAVPDVAGRCMTAVDAGPMRDEPPRDAGVAPPLDASAPDANLPPPTIGLHVQITGKGSVLVDGRGSCSSNGAQHGDCVYDVARGVAQTVHAVQIQFDQVFIAWTSATCSGEDASCTFTPTAATTIVVKFDHARGG